MQPENSKIVYRKDNNRTNSYLNEQFTFLSFTFRPLKAQNKRLQLFASFLPAVSPDALTQMRQKVQGWRRFAAKIAAGI